MNTQHQDAILSQGLGVGLKFYAGSLTNYYAPGTYEIPLQRALHSCLKTSEIFYDIGASMGFFSVLAARIVGELGHVYAFEPVPENVEIINHNVTVNNFSHVSIFPVAVSHTQGEGELLLAHHPGGATLSNAGTPPDLKGTLAVQTVCIDDLVKQKTLKPPAVVKVDVEGAEIDVLRGMINTIKKYQPILMYEVDDGEKEAFQRKGEEIATFLVDLDYKLIHLDPAYPNIPWYVGHVIALPDNK